MFNILGPSVQFSSVAQSCPTLRPHESQHARPPCPSPTPGVYSSPCLSSQWWHPSHPLSSPSPPAPNPSQHQGLFQWVNSLHEVAKVLEFQLQHQSFQWTPGLISFRMDWLDLLAVHRTLKSLLQHHSSKASIFWRSAFFTVQLSHPYMTTGKTIALTRRTFIGKVISLLFNMLSRLVITFLPRSKHLLISWLKSPQSAALDHSCDCTLTSSFSQNFQFSFSFAFPLLCTKVCRVSHLENTFSELWEPFKWPSFLICSPGELVRR